MMKGMNKKKGMHKKVTMRGAKDPTVLAKKKGMYKKGKK